MVISGMLLLYTIAVAPVQIGFFRPTNNCDIFPTLFWDVAVDCFFVVRAFAATRARAASAARASFGYMPCRGRASAARVSCGQVRWLARRQMEVVLQFGMGFYGEDGTYQDDLGTIAVRYVSSPFLFWFALLANL